MKEPQLNPQVADFAPAGPALTAYDEEHIITYLRLLDADNEGSVSGRAAHRPRHRDRPRAAGV
jgi:hypothetical protein